MKHALLPYSNDAKRVFFVLLLFASCKKSTDLPPVNPSAIDLAKNYVGTYHVTEDASVFYPEGAHTISEFTGHIIRDYSYRGSPIVPDGRLFRDTINVIAFVQSGRNPAPNWAAPGRDVDLGSDTITFKVFKSSVDPLRDTIMGVYGGLADAQVLGKDSLLFNYMYGWGAIAYVVKQTWVKQ
ncbi:hypothetical protein Q4E93_20045 [Flavitalea sp. BT771]|uniref:hypothetical protein n=1 Tax=Flavitalea sp. BT771 TaxID=3063329 RepID=UPI0026E1920E|nr:hypothetical protein [Flavitalea sp. BT771]MDO6432911.1 hypothetical protein [Flavitalea sp. BT771]MDV6221813.1 hypothetical protein [Flavitalea sp. BT771]